NAGSVLHYNTFVQRIFSHNLTSSPFRIYLELCDEHSGEPRREHYSRFDRSCPHQIQHQFRLKAPQLDVCLDGFFVARISLEVSTERAMQLLRSELQLPSALRRRPSDWRLRLRPCGCWLVRRTTVRGR